MNKRRVIIELIVLCCLLLTSFFTVDLQNEFLGISQLEFTFELLGIYIFFRVLIDLIVIIIKYKRKGVFKKYSGEDVKIYFENSIYGHLTIIFFILMFSSTLMISALGLFLIFGILWLLSELSILLIEKKSIKLKNNTDDRDENQDDFYNFIYIDFYSDLGFEFFKILTDNTFGILNNYKNENSIVLLDKLSKSNYLFLVPRSLFFGDVNLLCGVFNSYLEKLDIKCLITPDDILEKDDLKLGNRRNDYLDTLTNDLGIIDEILRKKKYRVISMAVDDSEDTFLCLSVVTDSVYRKIKNFQSKNVKK